MSVGSVAGVTARIAEIQARISAMQARPSGGVVGSAAGRFDQHLGTAVRQADAGSHALVDVAPPRAAADVRPMAGGRASGAPPTGARWAAALPLQGQSWAAEIDTAARRHGIDPRLLASLVWAESGFDPSAESHAGALGLAQLMPGTAAGLGVDPHDPVQNLDGGARFLRAQLDRFGREDLALAAYNAGPARVASAGGIPQIAETQAYVPKVLGYYQQLKEAS